MRQTVLIVDDEADLLTTYHRLLTRAGYSTITVATRRAALATLETERVDLIVADRRLSDGDGLDVVRVARARQHPPPVIVVTGLASEESRRQALDAGATGYLAKPFSTSALTLLIREALAQPSA